MSTAWIVAYILGALVIAALSFYLGRLLMQIKQAEADKRQAIDKRNAKLSSDIHTIAWAMREGQCDFSEGAIRICVLLDHLIEAAPQDHQSIYSGIFALYDNIKHMPTHQARAEQSKLERLKMDAQRLSFEEQFETQIKQDIDKLIARFGPNS